MAMCMGDSNNSNMCRVTDNSYVIRFKVATAPPGSSIAVLYTVARDKAMKVLRSCRECEIEHH